MSTLVVSPGSTVEGRGTVPGDKSIAHRWLIMAAVADGRSSLDGLPRSLDTRSTAACLAQLVPPVRPALEAWAARARVMGDPDGSTWNREGSTLDLDTLELRSEGRAALREPTGPVRCGNSGTTMRLLTGLLAAARFETVLTGDRSLSSRPMERVAEPLRAMGAHVATDAGHAPVTVRGSDLRGIDLTLDVPSAQVKGAVLLAATAARGLSTIVEAAPTRDHTERLLRTLHAPMPGDGPGVCVEGPFQHRGFAGRVPGDVSSAAFLIAAAAVTGGRLELAGVGLNPSRLGYLRILHRMGVEVETAVAGEEVGEPVGTITVPPIAELRPVTVTAEELPLVVDEVPVIAALAAHAAGVSRFEGAGELRLKESDRLAALASGLRSLGGNADDEGDRLVVEGRGLSGGSAGGAGDHRIAMALSVASLAARGRSRIDGIESAEISFPGFADTLAGAGAHVEVET